MQFEIENMQMLFEQFNENFGDSGELNLIIDIEDIRDHKGILGYDMVIYDVTGLDILLVNGLELNMYCDDHGIDKDEFEIKRTNFIKMWN